MIAPKAFMWPKGHLEACFFSCVIAACAMCAAAAFRCCFSSSLDVVFMLLFSGSGLESPSHPVVGRDCSLAMSWHVRFIHIICPTIAHDH